MSNNEKICSLLKELPDQALMQIAQYFAVLAEPTRLRILNALRESERNVGELAMICSCSQANVSRHLSNLANHGIITRESRKTSVYYKIADPSIYALCDLVCHNVASQLSGLAAALASKSN